MIPVLESVTTLIHATLTTIFMATIMLTPVNILTAQVKLMSKLISITTPTVLSTAQMATTTSHRAAVTTTIAVTISFTLFMV